MTSIDHPGEPSLAALVAAAPGSLVLPDRPRGAALEVAAPLRLLDALPLGDGLAVAVVADAEAGRWVVPLRLQVGEVRRASAGDGAAEALLTLLRTPGTGQNERFSVTTWFGEPTTGERAIAVDQTNDSVVVGDRAVVKWSVQLPRDVTAGHPAAARVATLVAQGFSGIPQPWGQVCWHDPDGGEVSLASVASYLPGAVDGWDWAVDDVRRLAAGILDQPAAIAPAARLGQLTATMHLALSATGVEAATVTQVARWRLASLDDLATARGEVDGERGRRLAGWAAPIAAAFDGFLVAAGTPLIDVHGDLHVGQVLRFGRPPQYVVTDFDGNPVQPEAERLQRRPAAYDVAGMLASLDHVGRVVIRRTEGVDPAVVETWISSAQNAFLDSYRRTLSQAGGTDLFDERLLPALRVHQECREYLYAVRHLPHWTYAPDGALAAMFPPQTRSEHGSDPVRERPAGQARGPGRAGRQPRER